MGVEAVRFMMTSAVFIFLTYLATCTCRLRLDLASRKRTLERVNEDLRKAQKALSQSAQRPGMAEVAADVLHQVGELA